MNLLAKDFWKRIALLTTQNNITKDQIAKDCDIPIPTMKGWKYRGIFPDGKLCVDIATKLNTSVEFLVYGKNAINPKIYIDNECIDLSEIALRINKLDINKKKAIMSNLLQQIEFWENN